MTAELKKLKHALANFLANYLKRQRNTSRNKIVIINSHILEQSDPAVSHNLFFRDSALNVPEKVFYYITIEDSISTKGLILNLFVSSKK